MGLFFCACGEGLLLTVIHFCSHRLWVTIYYPVGAALDSNVWLWKWKRRGLFFFFFWWPTTRGQPRCACLHICISTLPIINTSPLMFPVWSSHSDAMLVSGQNMSRLRICVATKGTARFLSSVRSFSACLIFVVLFAVKRSSHVAGCCFNENLPQTQQTTVLFIDESSDGVMNGWICGTASPVMSDTKWWR